MNDRALSIRVLTIGAALALMGTVPSPSARAATVPRPTCHGHAATIVGTPGPDRIHGTRGRDVIVARGGADRITGRGGRDLICAGGGADHVSAGPGDDHVFGGGWGDILLGGSGHDVVHGGAGPDVLRGGRGGDRIFGGPGKVYGTNQLFGGRGSDQLVGGPDTDHLDGGPGADQVTGGAGQDFLSGGTGNDTLSDASPGVGNQYRPAPDVFSADPGDDTWIGTGVASYVTASSGVTVDETQGTASGDSIGHDTVRLSPEYVVGSLFSDHITGGPGADDIDGHGGGDVISSGAGDDRVRAFDGDTIDAGPGNDSVTGPGWYCASGMFCEWVDTTSPVGPTVVHGGDGNDAISFAGTSGSQWAQLYGDAGDDGVFGTYSVAHGGDGNDRLGGDAHIQAYGEAGDDAVSLGEATIQADDVLSGGDGTNSLSVALERHLDAGAPYQQVTLDLQAGTLADDAVSVPATGFSNASLEDEGAFFHEGPFAAAFVIRGTDGPNTLAFHQSGHGSIYGLGGDDVLLGVTAAAPDDGGDDLLDGGAGNDTGDGGVGTDTCVSVETPTSCETIQP